ncbi:hypothetical protein P691DRAFT_354174 [Macrolepiota fuliginosa MF-IS2]|uniref:Uncharacterized protein n=1 Tax=Macrolepiota fuliginosa MF-IS2 TaxID=1400762 RepID=A0A9P5XJH7_9AGAR|nr:hypothetical protein P691DRAFT_354174 [Macrolepiota fuliginosa MF-IS2]
MGADNIVASIELLPMAARLIEFDIQLGWYEQCYVRGLIEELNRDHIMLCPVLLRPKAHSCASRQQTRSPNELAPLKDIPWGSPWARNPFREAPVPTRRTPNLFIYYERLGHELSRCVENPGFRVEEIQPDSFNSACNKHARARSCDNSKIIQCRCVARPILASC